MDTKGFFCDDDLDVLVVLLIDEDDDIVVLLLDLLDAPMCTPTNSTIIDVDVDRNIPLLLILF